MDYEWTNDAIAARLIELRTRKGIKQNKLANLSGVTQSHVRNVELSKTNITIRTLEVLSHALGVSVGYFFTEIDMDLVKQINRLSPIQQKNLSAVLKEFIDKMNVL